MIDMAATARNLSASHHNSLYNKDTSKNRRSALIGAVLVLLSAGWFAFHHRTDGTLIAAVHSAVHRMPSPEVP
jgi:hypothetical protein